MRGPVIFRELVLWKGRFWNFGIKNRLLICVVLLRYDFPILHRQTHVDPHVTRSNALTLHHGKACFAASIEKARLAEHGLGRALESTMTNTIQAPRALISGYSRSRPFIADPTSAVLEVPGCL